MSLYDTRYGTVGNVYGDVSGIPAQAQERKMLAQRLLSSYGDMPQGQMISGHYVAPSWTQQLAAAIKGPLARSEINAANKQLDDYNTKKRQDIASILSGQAPQQVQIDGQARTETPEEVQSRLRPLIYQAASQYGNDPALQLALGDLNYGRQRADTKSDIAEGRTYQEGRESVKRQQQLDDVANQQEFQRIMMKEQQGFQTTQQEKQFAQQYKMMQAQQGFQAQQNALSRAQQERLAGANDAPVSVLGQDGKPVYVTRQKALGQQPYSAKQEAQDVAKVQQQQQAELSAQQVLDQAALLYGHKGRQAGTGLSSFIGNIPATDAKDFRANLDTFKAQTFVPMVSALKGMGALSDAEGRKLSESVGALDPSMSEKAFAESLQRITKTLYDKAKASGLNVSLPDFAVNNPQKGATGGWGIQEVK